MKLTLFSLMMSSLHDKVMSYNMGALITCYEQNDEEPAGFKDLIWQDPESVSCKEYPELHEAYMHSGLNPGKGDVCDHVDPITSLTRDSCYFNVIFGPEVNPEKTWSYKCWQFERCPVLGDDEKPRVGIQVTHKRINACCKEDFCNGDELIKILAHYGTPEKYPPDFQELCDIDFSQYGWYVKFTVPGYEHCGYDPENPGASASESESDEATTPPSDSSEEDTYSAHTGILHNLYHNAPDAQIPQSAEIVNVADILLIFTYFVIGIACLGIGIFIGQKWQTSVMQQAAVNKLEV